MADYVEARGILLPAVDYLQRAVNAARYWRCVTGSLLAMVRSCTVVSFVLTDLAVGGRSTDELGQRHVS
jgi:hypothetical protein